jgi:hypothetical protein
MPMDEVADEIGLSWDQVPGPADAEAWLLPFIGVFDPQARKVFDALIASTPTGHFKVSDAPLLGAYARASVLEHVAAEAMTRDAAGLPRCRARAGAAVAAFTHLPGSPTGQSAGGRSRAAGGSKRGRPLSWLA